MIEKPMLFSGPMVRALLDGRKTQTRRVLRVRHKRTSWTPLYQPVIRLDGWWEDTHCNPFPCPHPVGSRIWVKEKFAPLPGAPFDKRNGVIYGADESRTRWTWKPSIHMPRWASRITLEVTKVSVERLQDIAHYDCEKEGLEHVGRAQWICPGAGEGFTEGYHGYRWLWEQIHGEGSWESNPWVWVYEFKRVK